MRTIKYIAVHCTGTKQDTSVSSILTYWKTHLGWKNPGYHFIVNRHGKITELQPIEKPSNGVRGYNSQTINISYIGGIDSNGVVGDTRTPAQKIALLAKITELKRNFPDAIIQGHRDFPNVAKTCPNFEAKEEYGLL